jgi:YgiT-type zinc finger domain-containing protein
MKDPETIRITRCPTCGSSKIRRVTRDIAGTFRGRPYVTRKVTFEECPHCGERLFDHAAMQKMQAARPHLRPSPKKPLRKLTAAAS